VHDPDTELAVTDPPDPGQQQFLERRSSQGAPAGRPAGRHGRRQLHRVRVGQQMDLAITGDEERHPAAPGGVQRGQGGGQGRRVSGQRTDGKGPLGQPHGLGGVQPGEDPVDGADPRRVRG
jgi:hypothetical protein